MTGNIVPSSLLTSTIIFSVGEYTCKYGDVDPVKFILKMRVAVTFTVDGNEYSSVDQASQDVVLGKTNEIKCRASTKPTQKIQ